MQRGGDMKTASIENNSAGIFIRCSCKIVSQRFNEWHMLNTEKKDICKWGGGFEEYEELLLGLVMLKRISFDFPLWVRIALSHKQDGNWKSKNLASHSAFLEFWEDFGGGGWFCLVLTFKCSEGWGLGCSKACRAHLHSDLGILPYCLGIYLSPCEVAAGR